ncbi:MAG: flagellar protein FlaG [Nitrospirota bacterium]
MKIDPIVQNADQLAVRGQPSSGNGQGAGKRRAEAKSPPTIVDIQRILQQEHAEKREQAEKIRETQNNPVNLKAIFAIDEDKNVVIQLLDDKGEMVRQIPPEEYMEMVKKLDEMRESIYSKKV